MTKWILAGIAIVALMVPAGAAAEPLTPEMESDYFGALAWWGVDAPPRCASVARELVPNNPESPEAIAEASQPGETDVAVPCILRIYAVNWTGGCAGEVTLKHEVGHLLGYGHSADPTNIMYPTASSMLCPHPPAPEPAIAATDPSAAPIEGIPIPVWNRMQIRQMAWSSWREHRRTCQHRPACTARLQREAVRIRRRYSS